MDKDQGKMHDIEPQSLLEIIYWIDEFKLELSCPVKRMFSFYVFYKKNIITGVKTLRGLGM